MPKGRRFSIKGAEAKRRPSLVDPKLDVQCEGYLDKRSSSNKWQKRYFQIAGHYLRYFADDKADMAKLKGGMDLSNLTKCAMSESIGGVEILLCFKDEGDYALKTTTEKIGQKWLDVLEEWAAKETPEKEEKEEKDDKEDNEDTSVKKEKKTDENAGEESNDKEDKIEEDKLEEDKLEDGNDMGEENCEEEQDRSLNTSMKIEGKLEVLQPLKANVDKESWQKRFLQIRGPFLVVFPTQAKDDKRGKVAMDLDTLSNAKMYPSFQGYEMLLSTSDSVIHLRVMEEDTADEWMEQFKEMLIKNRQRSMQAESFFANAMNGTKYDLTIVKNENGVGLSLEGVDHGDHEILVVDGFVDDTPAAEAHKRGEIMKGDVVVEVDGKSVVDVPFDDIMEMFGELTEIKLKVSRGTASQDEIEQHLAASKLQSIQRGRIARKEIKEQHQSAAKLQAIQRGRRARAEMALAKSE